MGIAASWAMMFGLSVAERIDGSLEDGSHAMRGWLCMTFLIEFLIDVNGSKACMYITMFVSSRLASATLRSVRNSNPSVENCVL